MIAKTFQTSLLRQVRTVYNYETKRNTDCYCFTVANKAEKTCVLMDAFFSPLSLFSQRVVIKKRIYGRKILKTFSHPGGRILNSGRKFTLYFPEPIRPNSEMLLQKILLREMLESISFYSENE
jgi:hypothetical protein